MRTWRLAELAACCSQLEAPCSQLPDFEKRTSWLLTALWFCYGPWPFSRVLSRVNKTPSLRGRGHQRTILNLTINDFPHIIQSLAHHRPPSFGPTVHFKDSCSEITRQAERQYEATTLALIRECSRGEWRATTTPVHVTRIGVSQRQVEVVPKTHRKVLLYC